MHHMHMFHNHNTYGLTTIPTSLLFGLRVNPETHTAYSIQHTPDNSNNRGFTETHAYGKAGCMALQYV